MNALVTVGRGVDNIIMATQTVAAVASLGFATDVLCEGNYPDAAGLLRGWEIVHELHTQRPQQHYSAVVRTLARRAGCLRCGVEFGPDGGDLRQTHEVVANLTAARALGFTGSPPPAHCEFDRVDDLNLPEHYAVIAPGYGGWAADFWERKRWPHWEGFCARFLAESDLDLVVLGPAKERCAWPHVDGGPIVNLCGRTTLRQAAGVIAGARFVLAIDNGLAHVAAALGVPVFALFGATSEATNRPWGADVTVLTTDVDCRPCQATPRWAPCDLWDCMQRLDPDVVVDAIVGRGLA